VPDPFDPGPPIVVFVDGRPVGDLGARGVDAQLLSVIVHSQSEVAEWLASCGVVAEAAPEPRFVHGDVSLDELTIGQLGQRDADARMVWAIAAREGQLGPLTHEQVEAAFPGSAWI
jgi:hypothetical protein